MDTHTGTEVVMSVVEHTAMDSGIGFWVSIVIFAITFAIILTERIHRSVIGLI